MHSNELSFVMRRNYRELTAQKFCDEAETDNIEVALRESHIIR